MKAVKVDMVRPVVSSVKVNPVKANSTKAYPAKEDKTMEDEKYVIDSSNRKEELINRFIDLFSCTSHPLRKKVRLENTITDDPRTWVVDMKETNANIYYCVSLGLIGISDLKEYIFNRSYPRLLEPNFKLYLVSPQGITDIAQAFLDRMSDISFISAEDLALKGANILLNESPYAREQVKQEILPLYEDILPSNWRYLLGIPEEKLIFNGDYPLGVYKTGNKYQAKFTRNGRDYYLGLFFDPMMAGEAVRDKMMEVSGNYSMTIRKKNK